MIPEVLHVTNRRIATLTLLKLADLTVVGVALTIALGAALSTGGDVNLWLSVMQMRVTVQNAIFVAAYLAAWHMLLKSLGLYRSCRIAPASREAGSLTYWCGKFGGSRTRSPGANDSMLSPTTRRPELLSISVISISG